MSAISQVKSTTGVNLLTIKLGYFLAKTVGIIFLGKRNIVMEEQERLDHINLQIARSANLKYLSFI